MTSRRHFLQGLAATLALPSLEAFGSPVGSLAAAPRRLAFVYVPNGVNLSRWLPQGDTLAFADSLAPLAGLEKHISLLRHLDHDKARANGDGAGDHARANATFLTGCQARKTAGADIRAGISVDQIAARQMGHETRLPSLELSTDPARRSGQCDSGYSCAYQFNLSWLDEDTPAPAERDPRLVFEKLFGSGNAKQDAARRVRRKSILDFVRGDAKRLQGRLGATDRGKVEEYLTSVRALEKRIESAENHHPPQPPIACPAGIPESYAEHIQLQFELMALAFQTDSTRVSTFLLAHDGSNRPFPELGIANGHHSISHHRNDTELLDQIATIDRFYAEQFAGFLRRMAETPDGEGSLLDHSMIVYGSGIGDGNRHNHDDLPLLLAGGGGGSLQPGQILHAAEGTPMTNLHLALLERMGVQAERVGDSTGVLAGI
ncbi:hypothetical protein HNR46_003117 [Haloferula luteola]|uniref:DUF1552 domain-containing protein n=1 Tax=Haloferula luteola TaxID=595692 RepID=A0A840VE08_9BACT|nr:DUF1552 domain-containing protein [Haloferula luteola]MBB5352868.1 hypothetical protein [Haloferula luteola]